MVGQVAVVSVLVLIVVGLAERIAMVGGDRQNAQNVVGQVRVLLVLALHVVVVESFVDVDNVRVLINEYIRNYP